MAKMNETLSFEEKLEQALIADWEQPYKVPENWCWVKFGILAMDMADGPFGSNLKKEHYTEKKEVRIIQLSNIGENGWRDDNTKYTTYEHAKTISRSMVKSGEIVIAKMMPAGRAIKVPDEEKAYILSSDAIKFVPNKLMHTDYLLYAINSNSFRNQVSSETQGITRARTSIGKIKTYAFPLAPLAEQQRIVDRIERLFEKLDRAKELVQNAIDSFEERTSAILHQAFTGELTKKWREENDVSLDGWEEKRLDEYVDTKYGYTESASEKEIGPKFLRITDIQNDSVDWNEVPYCKITDKDFINYKLNKNDIVVARTGATTGKSYLIQDEVNSVFASYLIRINIQNTKKLNSKYLYKFLQSQLYWNQITELSSGIAQPGVNANKLKTIIIPIPEVVEQTEIVRILDSIFEKEKQAKELTDVIEKIDLMKKAILARAFRGELGANDPNEESALELLKEVLLER